MAKINFVDRAPNYPGRVKLIPVRGQTDTYDMTRADSPVNEGTPLNKKLFDQLVQGLTESVTVYVSGSTGNDTTGTGASNAPFKTVQAAIDSIPKYLRGFHVQIDIANGTYEERVVIDGFYGGRLTLGVSGRTVTLRGVTVNSSAVVRLYISNITYSANFAGALLYAGNGSIVNILGPITLNGGGASVSGIGTDHGSEIVAGSITVAILNCAAACVNAVGASAVSFYNVEGVGNTATGLRAERGATISYATKNLTASVGDYTASGGRILSGSAQG